MKSYLEHIKLKERVLGWIILCNLLYSLRSKNVVQFIMMFTIVALIFEAQKVLS